MTAPDPSADVRDTADECGICADHARIGALIERSSLGSAEAKAARESVPNEIGIAIARAADYLRRAKAAEERLDAVRALADRADAYGRWLNGYGVVTVRDIRAALDGGAR